MEKEIITLVEEEYVEPTQEEIEEEDNRENSTFGKKGAHGDQIEPKYALADKQRLRTAQFLYHRNNSWQTAKCARDIFSPGDFHITNETVIAIRTSERKQFGTGLSKFVEFHQVCPVLFGPNKNIDRRWAVNIQYPPRAVSSLPLPKPDPSTLEYLRNIMEELKTINKDGSPVDDFKDDNQVKEWASGIIEKIGNEYQILKSYAPESGWVSFTYVTDKERLAKHAGVCHCHQKNGKRFGRIEIFAHSVARNKDRIGTTLLHEICHAMAWVIEEDTKHGKIFKKYAKDLLSLYPAYEVTTYHSFHKDPTVHITSKELKTKAVNIFDHMSKVLGSTSRSVVFQHLFDASFVFKPDTNFAEKKRSDVAKDWLLYIILQLQLLAILRLEPTAVVQAKSQPVFKTQELTTTITSKPAPIAKPVVPTKTIAELEREVAELQERILTREASELQKRIEKAEARQKKTSTPIVTQPPVSSSSSASPKVSNPEIIDLTEENPPKSQKLRQCLRCQRTIIF